MAAEFKQGEHCSRASEAHSGTPLLLAGIRLAAQYIALAASCGQSRLKVYCKPRVAVQATGHELVEITETPPFQIRNSNSYSLAAQITQCGGEPLLLPTATIAAKPWLPSPRRSLPEPTSLSSGGVSMGKFDFEEALHKLDAEFPFTGVKIQPGKPVVFGRLRALRGRGLTSSVFPAIPSPQWLLFHSSFIRSSTLLQESPTPRRASL